VYDHVLVGTDGSATATKAVEAAAQLAQVHGARLTIAHAFNPREPEPLESRAVEAEFPWLWSSGARAEALVKVCRRLRAGRGVWRLEG
jgi:nucleotide-binding universal stress UspA family protein